MFQYRQPLPSISPLWPTGARSAFYAGQPVYDGFTNAVVRAAAPHTRGWIMPIRRADDSVYALLENGSATGEGKRIHGGFYTVCASGTLTGATASLPMQMHDGTWGHGPIPRRGRGFHDHSSCGACRYPSSGLYGASGDHGGRGIGGTLPFDRRGVGHADRDRGV